MSCRRLRWNHIIRIRARTRTRTRTGRDGETRGCDEIQWLLTTVTPETTHYWADQQPSPVTTLPRRMHAVEWGCDAALSVWGTKTTIQWTEVIAVIQLTADWGSRRHRIHCVVQWRRAVVHVLNVACSRCRRGSTCGNWRPPFTCDACFAVAGAAQQYSTFDCWPCDWLTRSERQ